MVILFKNNTLQKQYANSSKAISSYGKQVAVKYIERVNIIKKAKSIDDLIKIRTLRCHQLKGDRKKEWSIKLTGFWRLIFTLHGDELQIARIEEVSKHYDD